MISYWISLPLRTRRLNANHSHASLLPEKGVDIATVSARLGRSSVAATADIYSHEIRGMDRTSAQVWDDLMQPARGEKAAGVN